MVFAWLVITALLTAACSGDGDGEKAEGSVSGSVPDSELSVPVAAAGETPRARGDADDPAIWVHPTDPARSLIIGTDKDDGLAVYRLDGTEVQFLDDIEPNNVDVRDGFPLGGENVPLVVASERERDRLVVYRIDVDRGRLIPASSQAIDVEIDPHGVCLYRSAASGRFYVFPNAKDGRTVQWELFDDGSGQVDARKVRGPWRVGGALEGCVADDSLGRLYIGEEDEGIWRYGAEPDASVDDRVLIDRTGGDGHLDADVEGLTIAYGPGDSGALIASSQGDDRFTVYDRNGDNAFRTRFGVPGARIDGCDETDGIDVTARPLAPDFPHGLFVCHDGDDEGGTNFKLVPLEQLSILNQTG